MNRIFLAVVAVLALGLAACQRQAAPERTAMGPASQATPASPPPSAEGLPAEAAPAGAALPPATASRPVPDGPAPQEAAPTAPAPTLAPEPAAAAKPEPTPTPRPRVVASGTALPIVLKQAVSTKTAKPEDRVIAELAEDVVVNDDVLLPGGSEVRGHVVTAQRSGRVKGRARLVVAFDRITANGKSYRIDATGFDVTAGSSKGKDAKIAGGAAAAGAVIGAIADGGSGAVKGGLIGGAAGGAAVLATRGEEVELAAGSRYRIELRKSLRLD